MRSVHDIVDRINESLSTIKSSVVYGIAMTAIRDNNGAEERVPMALRSKTEGQYIGVDDEEGIIIYHKLINMTSRVDKTRGVGREPFLNNVYSMAIIVFLNRARVEFLPDELVNVIQDLIPSIISLPPYQSIIPTVNSAILNDTQVWAAEYSADYSLSANQNLFQMNYTVEVTRLKGCFNNC